MRVRARDRDIFTDLAKLNNDVSTLTRTINAPKRTPSPGQGVPGHHPSVGNQWVDSLIQSHQEEYCHMKDLHFEETRTLTSEIHELRKRLHISTTDLEIANHNCKELQRVVTEKEAGVETATLKQSLRMKESAFARLQAQNGEAERQISELRGSLEEAIEAISKQYKENCALVKKVRHLNKAMSPQDLQREEHESAVSKELKEVKAASVALETTIWNIGRAAGAEPEADFSAVLRLISDRIDTQGNPVQSSSTDTDREHTLDLQITQLKAELAKRDASLAQAKQSSEQKVKKYLIEIQEKSTVILGISKEKAMLTDELAQLRKEAEERQTSGMSSAESAAEQKAAAASAQVSDLEQKLTTMGADFDTARATLRTTSEECNALRVEKVALQAQLDVHTTPSNDDAVLQEKLASALGRESVLSTQLEEARKELSAHIVTSEVSVQEKAAEVLRAKSDADLLTQEMAVLKADLAALQEQPPQVDSSELVFLQQQVATLQRENDGLRADVIGGEGRLREAVDEAEQLRGAAEALGEKNRMQQGSLAALGEELAGLREGQGAGQAGDEDAAEATLAEVSLSYAELSQYVGELQAAYKIRLAQQVLMAEALQAAQQQQVSQPGVSSPQKAAVAELQRQVWGKKECFVFVGVV